MAEKQIGKRAEERKVFQEKKAKALKVLQEAASEGGTIFYTKFYDKVGYNINSYSDHKKMNKILENIGIDELSESRPPLNALVISELSKLPLGGFFDWYLKTEDYKKNPIKIQFYIHKSLRERCHQQWGKEEENKS